MLSYCPETFLFEAGVAVLLGRNIPNDSEHLGIRVFGHGRVFELVVNALSLF